MSCHSTSSGIKLISHCSGPAKVQPEGNAGLRKAGTMLCFGHSGLRILGRVSRVHPRLQQGQISLGYSLLVFRSPSYWLMTPIFLGSVFTYIAPS